MTVKIIYIMTAMRLMFCHQRIEKKRTITKITFGKLNVFIAYEGFLFLSFLKILKKKNDARNNIKKRILFVFTYFVTLNFVYNVIQWHERNDSQPLIGVLSKYKHVLTISFNEDK